MMTQFELQSIALIIIMIGISHKSMQLKKNGPKINEALGKAVNAAISIKSGKESMVKLEKKYEGPENCNILKVPHVKKKILDAMKKKPGPFR